MSQFWYTLYFFIFLQNIFRVFHTHSASAQHPVSLNKDTLKNTLSNWQSAQNKANKK